MHIEKIPFDYSSIRKKAEEIIDSQPKDWEDLSIHDLKLLSHELKVHQIELEIQNETLREAQLELEKTRDKYSNLYDYAPIGYLTLNERWEIVNANFTAANLLGIERNQLINLPIYRIIPSKYHVQINEFLHRVHETATPLYIELAFKKTDGTMFEASVKALLVSKYVEENQFLLTFLDLSELKKSQEDLEKKENQMTTTVENLGDGVIITDNSGFITLINKTAESLLCIDSETALNQRFSNVVHLYDMNRQRVFQDLLERVKSEKSIINAAKNIQIIPENCKSHVIEFSASILLQKGIFEGFDFVFRDVSEKIEIDKISVQNQDLDSSSNNIRGIAHDYNNLLTVIIGNLSLLKNDEEINEEAYRMVLMSEEAANQAREITSQLMLVAKSQPPNKKISEISTIVKNAVEFILHGSDIEIQYQFDSDGWQADVDANQIRRALQNIVLNAKEAMLYGGFLSVAIDNTLVNIQSKLPLAPGPYVKITIQDTGAGISKDNLSHLFTPFFSTKANNRGLGLATSLSIIQQHGGAIDVDTKENEGTNFQIYLPAIIDTFSQQAETTAQANQEDNNELQQFKILIMDDEDLVREVLEKMLKKMGYVVEAVYDGESAITAYQTNQDSETTFDLIILDLTIQGGMGGLEAGKQILALNPDAKIIISSGYTTDSVLTQYHEYGFIGILPKPYTLKELKDIISSSLNK